MSQDNDTMKHAYAAFRKIQLIGQVVEVNGNRVLARVDVKDINVPVEFPLGAIAHLDPRPGVFFVWEPKDRNHLDKDDFKLVEMWGKPWTQEEALEAVKNFRERRERRREREDYEE